MKRCLLFILALSFGVFTYAQQRAVVSKVNRNVKFKKAEPIKDVGNSQSTYSPGTKSVSLLTDEDIGGTWYDLQTNAASQNRIYLFDDGFIGATWTMGLDAPGFADRGTGYNFFDGDNWGPEPGERIEDEKCGWPSYTKWGENGEIIANHTYFDGIWVGNRPEKGTGEWNVNILGGPSGAVDLTWPRVITTGLSNNIVHVISCTWVTIPALGQENALLYSRSQDGGNTWDIENYDFEELGPDYYENVGGDIYEFAEPFDTDEVAFLVGGSWTDLVLMRSEDNGSTWTKTVIWECPFPLVGGTNPQITDAFYGPDGAHHLAYDQNGKIHVVFGINRAVCDGSWPGSWFPGVGGIGYWNEDRPTFSADTNALSPYGDIGSELVEDYSLIGWTQDLNGNDTIDVEDASELAAYYLGFSSMPQIVIDETNHMFVVYSSITESYTGGLANQTYRHLWCRTSPNGEWWSDFTDLNSDLAYVYDECVFPSVAANSDENIYFTYQADGEPGLHVRGDEDPPGDNYTRVMSVAWADIISGVKENETLIKNDNVSQNYPNPFNGKSKVYVMLEEAATLNLEVHNIMGQLIYSTPENKYNSGKVEFTIDGSQLEPGIYFYSIVSGTSSVTKKMIIE